MDLQTHLKKLLKNKKFREEYYKPNQLGMEYKILRRMAGLSQKAVAEKIGSCQGAISRFERGDYMPSLRWLHKATRAIGYYLKVNFKPDNN